MYQWPLIVALVVSMFVGRVCPVTQKSGHGDEGNISTQNISNANHTSSVSNANKTVEASIKTAEDKKEKQNKTESSAPLESSTNVTSPHAQKTIDDGKHNCSSTKESTDMTNCYVTPHDNDEIIENDASTTEPTNTVTTATNKTETSTESQVTKAPPHVTTEEEDKKSVEIFVPLNNTETPRKIPYNVTTETDHSNGSIHTNESVSDAVAKNGTNINETSVSSVAPLLVDNVTANVGAVKSTDQNNKSMPSGMIALVTAISFAVAIAIVYIGMIIWRRYIEYRYGHRELLVNELEFDTNDLRHFEL
nr:PREDICTED: uncharacterized protein LOC100881002 isoform X1 [Megachile rotundata]XP_012140682.1 PREDICTED: uncharacterized protein LOC100881002 isoform X1 [Megachile rotundata]XP_012140691.1 PREDICTED: uncharacterized protein LOC100881002 isoform X1 [Megachile rotundata]XP_012140697.1 PREDICTED: uncharacterized protein LOC100881002 isoform X1 [Megachile rotundata]XP_012140699.1 PREDICTED: uncharacterized protein LOC100881002 isoform X1 [Megachile rotundata]XP_012140708.1 PREDICTED: uncharact